MNRQKVMQEINSFISDPRKLLTVALAALFDSSRKYPGILQAMYYNMSSPISVERLLSQSSISQNASQYGYHEDETLLLNEAEQSYNRIEDAITNNCINWMSHDTESSSQILQVPETQVGLSSLGGGNREIFDTRDLSQVNLVYNNITFQVYPGSTITNENVA